MCKFKAKETKSPLRAGETAVCGCMGSNCITGSFFLGATAGSSESSDSFPIRAEEQGCAVLYRWFQAYRNGISFNAQLGALFSVNQLANFAEDFFSLHFLCLFFNTCCYFAVHNRRRSLLGFPHPGFWGVFLTYCWYLSCKVQYFKIYCHFLSSGAWWAGPSSGMSPDLWVVWFCSPRENGGEKGGCP